MSETTRKPTNEKRSPSEGRGLYDLLADVKQYALALARTYETRRPRDGRRGRLHTV